MVVCGLCREHFDALQRLAEALPEDTPETLSSDAAVPPATAAEPASPRTAAAAGDGRSSACADVAESWQSWQEPAPDTDEQSAAAIATDPGERPAQEGRADGEGDHLDESLGDLERWLEDIQPQQRGHSPSVAASSRPKAAHRRAGLGRGVAKVALNSFLIVLLAIVGVVHGSYVLRAQLIEFPALEGWMAAICGLYDCRLQTPAAYRVLTVEARRLAADPDEEQRLVLDAVLYHAGAWRLAYPDVELTLRDLNGRVTARERFAPQQYVVDNRVQARLEAGIEPGARVPLRLELPEPAAGGESFTLTFHPPG